MKFDHPNLSRITEGLKWLREEDMAECRRLILMLPEDGVGFAGKFTEREMLFLVSVYERIPWREIAKIDPYDTEPGISYDECREAFAPVLAGHITYLFFCGPDWRFSIPGVTAEEQSDFALGLADKVLALSATESVALHVVLHAARVVPASVIRYDGWWHPAMMRRLLEAPEFDCLKE